MNVLDDYWYDSANFISVVNRYGYGIKKEREREEDGKNDESVRLL